MVRAWGTYPWFGEHRAEKIHPDDRESFKRVANNVKVFEFFQGNGNYNIFRYANQAYRINDTLSKILPEPSYWYGENVIIKNKGELKGKVCDVMWHFNEKQFYYFLSIDGKKTSKRYFEDELETVNA